MKKIYYLFFIIIIIMITIFIFLNKNENKIKKRVKKAKIKSINKKIENRTKSNVIHKKVFHKKKRVKISKKERLILLKAISEQLRKDQEERNFKALKLNNNNKLNKDNYNGVLEKNYIKKQIKEIIPEVTKCYENSLKNNPELAGKLTLEFTIIGDDDLGAIIEKSNILDNNMESPEEFNNCVLDSLYQMKLETPKEDGKMKIRYPFNFSNKE